MNLGLSTSFIIGGILLLSILAMNMSVKNNAIQLTQRQINQQKLSGISDMISHDIQKMGADRSGKTDPILIEATDNRIKFRSNINNQGGVETVSWEFQKIEEWEIMHTQNPNDYELVRTVRDADTGNIIEETPIRLGVTEFQISYFDHYGAVVDTDAMSTPLSSSQLENVQQLYIKINLQSAEKIYNNPNSNGDYVLSIWEKRFSPPNLEETI